MKPKGSKTCFRDASPGCLVSRSLVVCLLEGKTSCGFQTVRIYLYLPRFVYWWANRVSICFPAWHMGIMTIIKSWNATFLYQVRGSRAWQQTNVVQLSFAAQHPREWRQSCHLLANSYHLHNCMQGTFCTLLPSIAHLANDPGGLLRPSNVKPKAPTPKAISPGYPPGSCLGASHSAGFRLNSLTGDFHASDWRSPRRGTHILFDWFIG